MAPQLIPEVTTKSGFVASPKGQITLANARKALRKSFAVFEKSQKVYKERPIFSIGAVPIQAAQKPTKTISAPDRSTFEIVLTKSPYLTHEDQLGNRLLLNTFLPKKWGFMMKDGRSRETISAWDKRHRVIVPLSRLQAPHPLLGLLHELGHIHTAVLTDNGYWKAYDRANHIYHWEDFPDLSKMQKQSISPNEVLHSEYYPAKKVVDKAPAHYLQALLEIHRFKISDEYFSWAWTLLALANMYQAGFNPAARSNRESTQNYILKQLATHLHLAKMTTGISLT